MFMGVMGRGQETALGDRWRLKETQFSDDPLVHGSCLRYIMTLNRS